MALVRLREAVDQQWCGDVAGTAQLSSAEWSATSDTGVTFSVTSSCLACLDVYKAHSTSNHSPLLNKFGKCGEVGRREAGILKTPDWLDLPTPLEGIVHISLRAFFQMLHKYRWVLEAPNRLLHIDSTLDVIFFFHNGEPYHSIWEHGFLASLILRHSILPHLVLLIINNQIVI